jgi:hypothetical protein
MLSQESQWVVGRREFVTSGDEEQGSQAWKRRRLGHGYNNGQLTPQPQFSSEHIPYPTQSSSSIEYNGPPVTGNGYNLARCVRGSNPGTNFSSAGGKVLENLRDNDAHLECCYGMVCPEISFK